MEKGTVKDMNLSIIAVWDSDLGLAKSISENWEVCGKNVEVRWYLQDIEYKSEKYSYLKQ